MELPPPEQGLKRIYKAFFYSLKGFAAAYRHEAAFRQELWLCLLLTPLLFWLDFNWGERLLLLSSLLILLMVELLNSAIEALADLASPAYHPLAGRAKDLGSAAVFCALSFVALVWAWGLARALGYFT